jgi:hypothetical protein
MRFLSLIRVQENTGKQPSERLMTEMGKLMIEMKQAGKLLDTAGLAPTASSKRVRLRGGKVSVVDGPFAEAKEVIGGYAMLRCAVARRSDHADRALRRTARRGRMGARLRSAASVRTRLRLSGLHRKSRRTARFPHACLISTVETMAQWPGFEPT